MCLVNHFRACAVQLAFLYRDRQLFLEFVQSSSSYIQENKDWSIFRNATKLVQFSSPYYASDHDGRGNASLKSFQIINEIPLPFSKAASFERRFKSLCSQLAIVSQVCILAGIEDVTAIRANGSRVFVQYSSKCYYQSDVAAIDVDSAIVPVVLFAAMYKVGGSESAKNSCQCAYIDCAVCAAAEMSSRAGSRAQGEIL